MILAIQQSHGYLKTKYSGLEYPENDYANEEDFFSKWDYIYEHQDSFLIQRSQIVRYYNGEGKLGKPDTIKMGNQIINLKKARSYKNENNQVVRKYLYDDKNRLIEVKKGDDESMFKINYLDNKIQVIKYSNWNKAYGNSWVEYNGKGQIIKNYDESNLATHEFFYNDKGEMVEEKSYFKNKEPNYFKYEYKK